jgi:GTP-binding protein HflX
MPKDLFAAFRATFEEASDADLLLEVVDASDPEHEEHLETTTKILEELGLGERPRLRVYNKSDRLDAEGNDALAARANGIAISGNDPSSAARLLGPLERALGLKRLPDESVIELDDRVAE